MEPERRSEPVVVIRGRGTAGGTGSSDSRLRRRPPKTTKQRAVRAAPVVVAVAVLAIAVTSTIFSSPRKPATAPIGPLGVYIDACTRTLLAADWDTGHGAGGARSTCTELGRYHPGGLSGLGPTEAARQGSAAAATLAQSVRP